MDLFALQLCLILFHEKYSVGLIWPLDWDERHGHFYIQEETLDFFKNGQDISKNSDRGHCYFLKLTCDITGG